MERKSNSHGNSPSNSEQWKIKKCQKIYSNPWIDLYHHEVIDPNGGEGIYGTVHFRHRAVGVIPLDEDMNTWIVGQERFPLGEYSWEIPEGGAPLEEDSLDAAKRELLEETGLKAGKWIKLLEMDLSNSVTDEKAVVYLAVDITEGIRKPDATEKLKIEKLPFDDLWKKVESGDIRDCISVAAIQKVRLIQLYGEL